MFGVCGGIRMIPAENKQPKPWTGRFRTKPPRYWTADTLVTGKFQNNLYNSI